jgi:HSP20 family molecular chaperone IbpA
MRSENLEITIEGQRLCIRGERPDVCRASKCKFLVMSINYGPFESILDLPAGYDLGQARAVYLNGFLRIDVPRGQPKRAARARVVAPPAA